MQALLLPRIEVTILHKSKSIICSRNKKEPNHFITIFVNIKPLLGNHLLNFVTETVKADHF